jgi:prepilin signal peptidase PulO-like enzyme (type II secretory pathway)
VAALPIVGWLWPLPTRRGARLVGMRAVTEIIGALAFAGLTLIDLDPLRLLLRAALIADLLLILRVDWQHHLIQDRTILAGLLLAFAAAASQSTGALIGAIVSAVGAAAIFLLFYIGARVIYRQSAFGFGDVLLAGLIGAAVGPAAVVGTLFFGMVLASVGGLVIGLIRRQGLRAYFAYGSYLAAAAIAVLAFPDNLRGLPGIFW